MKTITVTVNGNPVTLDVREDANLLSVLNDDLQLAGAKEGCGAGECGACTVIVDGVAVASCLYPACEADGRQVETVEGLVLKSGGLHPLQKAFVEGGAVQCGFCTPGMIMSAKALLDRNPAPVAQEVKVALAGNICRCTGYTQIVEAVLAAAEEMRK
ncbi:MAG: Nicotinate dehydrogenase subunit A [Actinobacteria bacterium ADurb.Bin444]|nr:MAG: Nicotinate dehydrogenase subunit A [Actinobacteria bacterium ADurb.Bin444]